MHINPFMLFVALLMALVLFVGKRTVFPHARREGEQYYWWIYVFAVAQLLYAGAHIFSR